MGPSTVPAPSITAIKTLGMLSLAYTQRLKSQLLASTGVWATRMATRWLRASMVFTKRR